MAATIRLTRRGRRNRPYYRVVVADSHKARDGRFIEILGYYQPVEEPPVIEIDEERALEWLQRGASVSTTVRSLFRKKGILKRFHEIRYGKKAHAVASEEA